MRNESIQEETQGDDKMQENLMNKNNGSRDHITQNESTLDE